MMMMMMTTRMIFLLPKIIHRQEARDNPTTGVNRQVPFDHHIIAFDVLSSVASNLASDCKPRAPPRDPPLASALGAGCHWARLTSLRACGKVAFC